MKTKNIFLTAALVAASFTTFAQVGVGTTTPKGALQVKSTTSGVIIPQFADLTAIQAIKKADGTTAIDTEEQGMQVYNIAEKKNYMWNGTAWVAGGAGKFVDGTDPLDAVYTAGNVGIGTTAPISRFDIKSSGNDNTTQAINVLNSDDNVLFSVFDNARVGIGTNILTNHLTLGGTNDFRIGNYATDGADDKRLLLAASATSMSRGAYISLSGNEYAGDNGNMKLFAGSNGGSISFSTNNTLATEMIITNNGNVGIGTTAPSSLLTLKASNSTEYSSSGTSSSPTSLILQDIHNGDTTVGNTAFQRFLVAGASGTGIFYQGVVSGGSSSTAEYVIGARTSNSSYEERLRIDNLGNVGIGTPTPGSKLSVVGLVEYADDAAAGTAGLVAGDFYHTAGVVKVKL
jgi:hypothetical protein